MALSGSGLATAISDIPGIVIQDPQALEDFCDALINYLTANAVVNAGIAVQVNTGTGTGTTTGEGSLS